MLCTDWRPRATARRQQRREDGRHVWSFGLKVGYWPCLRAPFVRLDVGPTIVEFWVGWRSYIFAS